MSQETLYVFHGGRGWKSSNYINLHSINFNAILSHLVAQNNFLFDYEVTFLLVNNQVNGFAMFEHTSQVHYTIIKIITKQSKVIHEYL